MTLHYHFRTRTIIKPQYRPALVVLNAANHDPGWPWDAVAKQFPAFPGLQEWMGRAYREFIPFGRLLGAPAGFHAGPASPVIDEAGFWTFACSLPCRDTIEYFIERMLRQISVRSEYCQVLAPEHVGEEWELHLAQYLRDLNRRR